jgi:hypothetical protein
MKLISKSLKKNLSPFLLQSFFIAAIGVLSSYSAWSYCSAGCSAGSDSQMCRIAPSSSCCVLTSGATPTMRALTCGAGCPSAFHLIPFNSQTEWSAYLGALPVGTTPSAGVACYTDSDGDGYGVGASPSACGVSVCPGGTASNNTDCCDSDSNAYPGQNTFFVAQRVGCGGWDYNCDSTESRNYSGKNSRGSYVGSMGAWVGYTTTTNCTGGTTGPLGSIWVWNSAGAPTAPCGSGFDSCTPNLPIAGSTSSIFVGGSCVSYSAGCYDSFSSGPTTTTSCR